MPNAQTLIALARAKVHTDAELAARIAVDPQGLAGMKAGRRPVSPHHVAALCEVAGLSQEDSTRWLALILIDNAKDKEKAGVMRRAFLPVMAASLALGAALSPATTKNADAASPGTQAIVNKTKIVDLDRDGLYIVDLL